MQMHEIIGRLVDACGSHAALAKEMGVEASAISNWKRRGRIPPKQWRRAMDVARLHDVPLVPGDFFREDAACR